MKNICLFLLLIRSPLFSQDIFQKTIDIKYFSISTGFGGTSTAGGAAPSYTTPNFWLNLEISLPTTHSSIYLYTQLRTSFYLGNSHFPLSYILPVFSMESVRMGGLFGFGAIVKDFRSDSKGWYITVNTGIVVEGAVGSYTKNVDFNLKNLLRVSDRLLSIGFEVNTRAIYIIDKYSQLSIGFQIGYLYSPYSGDPFYANLDNRHIVGFHMLTYGLTFGVHL